MRRHHHRRSRSTAAGSGISCTAPTVGRSCAAAGSGNSCAATAAGRPCAAARSGNSCAATAAGRPCAAAGSGISCAASTAGRPCAAAGCARTAASGRARAPVWKARLAAVPEVESYRDVSSESVRETIDANEIAIAPAEAAASGLTGIACTNEVGPGHLRQPRPELSEGPRPPSVKAVGPGDHSDIANLHIAPRADLSTSTTGVASSLRLLNGRGERPKRRRRAGSHTPRPALSEALSDEFFGSSLAVVASGHEQPVPLFQQLARDNPVWRC